MDCSLPGSSIHGILQARILEWVAISFSRGSSRPRDWTQVSRIAGRHFNLWATKLRLKKGLRAVTSAGLVTWLLKKEWKFELGPKPTPFLYPRLCMTWKSNSKTFSTTEPRVEARCRSSFTTISPCNQQIIIACRALLIQLCRTPFSLAPLIDVAPRAGKNFRDLEFTDFRCRSEPFSARFSKQTRHLLIK